MATIFFAGDGITKEVPDGTRLQDAIDAARASILFGCREGSCATCMIVVLEGADCLNPPTSDEQMTLLPSELEDGIRLACQCVVKGGRVAVKASDS